MSTITSIVPYRDLRGAIDFLCEAFAFERHALHEDGEGNLIHVELRLGDDFIMPTEPRAAADGGVRIPPGSEHQLYVAVEDADAHHERAKAAGAEIVMALRDTDHGSRDYAAREPRGQYLVLRDLPPRRPRACRGTAPCPDVAVDRARRRWSSVSVHLRVGARRLTSPVDHADAARRRECRGAWNQRPMMRWLGGRRPEATALGA